MRATNNRFPRDMREAARLGYSPGVPSTEITKERFENANTMIRSGVFEMQTRDGDNRHGTIEIDFCALIFFGKPYPRREEKSKALN